MHDLFVASQVILWKEVVFMAQNNKQGKNDRQEHMPFCRGHFILRPWILPHD